MLKKIITAKHRGFCAGVERAVEIVEKSLVKYGAPVYVRHEIVHNKFVVNNLKEKGVIFVESLDEIPQGTKQPVIFSAHGVAKRVIEKAKNYNMLFYDAICPLVSKIHKEIIQLDETINEEQLDNLIAAINSKEQEEVMEVIGEVFDSSFEVKSKPKPNKTVLLSALEDSLSNQIDSLTSYSPTQSAYIQIGAFKKENISQADASDVSNKIGTDVEVIPTLISDPVMYRILVGPTHKDEIVGVIADIMELGISDYFLTHG